jgi:hypothetical protein
VSLGACGGNPRQFGKLFVELERRNPGVNACGYCLRTFQEASAGQATRALRDMSELLTKLQSPWGSPFLV